MEARTHENRRIEGSAGIRTQTGRLQPQNNHNTQRYKIEDCFRVLKTNFAARPVYHQKKEYIIANFMICYTALLLYRLLDKKCYQPKELNKKLKKILG